MNSNEKQISDVVKFFDEEKIEVIGCSHCSGQNLYKVYNNKEKCFNFNTNQKFIF
jgi:metal-dependent hydrolase (beta-lactamase superfamily II)